MVPRAVSCNIIAANVELEHLTAQPTRNVVAEMDLRIDRIEVLIAGAARVAVVAARKRVDRLDSGWIEIDD